MTALELGRYLFSLADNEPKRRDARLNDPLTHYISRTIFYSIRCNNARINTEEDYRFFMRSAQEAINNIDMVETLISIWFFLQESKSYQIKNPEKQKEFISKYEYVVDFVGESIVKFRDNLDHAKELVSKSWSRKVSKSKVGN